MYLCYDVDMWSIYGMDIRLLKEHPEYKEQIKLLPTRWEKVNKIKKEEDRLRSIAAGILLSYGLRENGIDLDACQLIMGTHGKPQVAGCEGLHFNLSHTGNYAVAVFSDAPVGIDIEHRRALKQTLLDKCFTKDEQAWIQSQPDKEMAFVRLWTAKESYVKWSGEGITFPLKSIAVHRRENGIASYPKKDGIVLYREGILQPVSFAEYDEIPDYHICVCTESEKENVAEIIWLQEDSFS